MSKESGGYYVEWTGKSGALEKGVVMYADQKESFRQYRKVMIRVCNDDLTLKKDEAGRQIISLREAGEIKVIGYID
jgi:hypothetical protein